MESLDLDIATYSLDDLYRFVSPFPRNRINGS